MKLMSGVLAAGVLGLGATSVYLYSELDAERSRVSTQAAVCGDEQAQIEALQHQRVAFEPDAMAGEERPSLSAPGLNSAGEVVLANALDRGMAADRAGMREFATIGSGGEIPRARHEAVLRRLYNGLVRELNLSPEQEAQLLDLLLEQRIEQFETVRKFAGDRAAMTQAMNELKQGNDTELMAALGDKYLQFEDYQKSLGERMQIEQAALQLDAAGVPLKEDQQRKLLDVMVDERERLPRPTWPAGMPPERALAQQREWQDDYEQRLRGRLSGVLTSEQLKQYDVFLNLQATQRRRQFETWRESSRQTLGPAPSNAM